MFGSHLSIAGGMHLALLQAEVYGMQCVQVFTKNQQQWKCRPLCSEAIGDWSSHCRRLKFRHTVSHASYLINLASPDAWMWEAGIQLYIEEMRRCDLLGIPYLVTHPGAHMGTGEAAAIGRIADALNAAYAALPGAKVITCLESTAGQGTTMGHRLEHLAQIMARVSRRSRIGVCLDTAHLFAAGYDFRGRKYARFRGELDRLIAPEKIKVLHLNDSKKPLGSRVDRHEHIGLGMIGLSGFRGFVRDAAFAGIPKILETPKGKDPAGVEWDTLNLQQLQRLLDGGKRRKSAGKSPKTSPPEKVAR